MAKYRCARCGKQHSNIEATIYRSWTKLRYCAYNLDACARRAAANKRKLERLQKAAARLGAEGVAA